MRQILSRLLATGNFDCFVYVRNALYDELTAVDSVTVRQKLQ